jgi:hypothetical protein
MYHQKHTNMLIWCIKLGYKWSMQRAIYIKIICVTVTSSPKIYLWSTSQVYIRLFLLILTSQNEQMEANSLSQAGVPRMFTRIITKSDLFMGIRLTVSRSLSHYSSCLYIMICDNSDYHGQRLKLMNMSNSPRILIAMSKYNIVPRIRMLLMTQNRNILKWYANCGPPRSMIWNNIANSKFYIVKFFCANI